VKEGRKEGRREIEGSKVKEGRKEGRKESGGGKVKEGRERKGGRKGC
jgi:hypothetical protein